ncbi:transposase [Teredinibacter turnerae]|uniref:transposase n=1 Tax=Teredinibacter turnerae TaxID=2426 RepID=UPI00048D3FC9|nr:transposase [Teredinibacter turnerae]
MSNHIHIVVKLHPKSIKDLSPDNILKRWCCLFKGPALVQNWRHGEEHDSAKQQTVFDIAELYRNRLMDTTPANVHDINLGRQLLHGNENRMWGDACDLGIEKREEAPGLDIDWFVGCRPGKRKTLSGAAAQLEKIKASVRAKVEHPFRII